MATPRDNASKWWEIWARLLAFHKNLPHNYEIEERLIREYHSMVDEFEVAEDLTLKHFGY